MDEPRDDPGKTATLAFSVLALDQLVSVVARAARDQRARRKMLRRGALVTIDGTWMIQDGLYRQPAGEPVFVATRITRQRRIPRWPLSLLSVGSGLVMGFSLLGGGQWQSRYELLAERTRCPPGARGFNIKDGSSYFDAATALFYCLNDEGQLHGPWVQIYLGTTRKRKEARYRHGQRHGPYREWYETGQLKLQTAYREDQLHGPWREWFASGQAQTHGQYDRGRAVGHWISWQEGEEQKATLLAEGNYLAGAREGKWIFYDLAIGDEYAYYLNALYRGKRWWRIHREEVTYQDGDPCWEVTILLDNGDLAVGPAMGDGRWILYRPDGTVARDDVLNRRP